MKKLLLIICCLLVLPVHAASWVQISDNEYIDADSVQNYVNDHGDVKYKQKSFWTKKINDGDKFFENLNKINNDKIKYIKTRHIIDFNNNSLAIKGAALYGTDESVISSYTNEDFRLNWMSIVPETVGEEYYNLIKKPKQLKKIYKWQQET